MQHLILLPLLLLLLPLFGFGAISIWVWRLRGGLQWVVVAILFWFATLIYIYLSIWEAAILFWFATFYLPYLGRGCWGFNTYLMVEAGGGFHIVWW
jgi:hypothetical protein